MNKKWPWVVLLLLSASLGVGGFLLWRANLLPRPAAQPVVAAEVPDAGVEPQAPAVDLAKGDALVKGLVPEAWLEGGDSIRRAAAAVYAVSMGQSPRVMVPFLDPGGEFIVDEVEQPGAKPVKPAKKSKKKGKPVPGPKPKYFISEKNDARYDAVTAAFTSIDAAAVGKLYGEARPYLDAVFREIAPPGKTFDAAFTQAVDRLAAVPIADGPREVVPMETGIGYAWADPKIEALAPAEKHLLRMGPRNARAVVKQLQAFREAMKAQ
ncbi:MAG: DUF3014 domain-containing protein [Myxococcaceae bacterium]|nr:DUF3014 domain-containing protein [Myxococcaceae bacterium]